MGNQSALLFVHQIYKLLTICYVHLFVYMAHMGRCRTISYAELLLDTRNGASLREELEHLCFSFCQTITTGKHIARLLGKLTRYKIV